MPWHYLKKFNKIWQTIKVLWTVKKRPLKSSSLHINLTFKGIKFYNLQELLLTSKSLAWKDLELQEDSLRNNPIKLNIPKRNYFCQVYSRCIILEEWFLHLIGVIFTGWSLEYQEVTFLCIIEPWKWKLPTKFLMMTSLKIRQFSYLHSSRAITV